MMSDKECNEKQAEIDELITELEINAHFGFLNEEQVERLRKIANKTTEFPF